MRRQMLLLLALLIAGAIAWFSFGNTSHHERIDGQRARALVDGGARLVDVRTPGEFEQRHLPSAINVPLQSLKDRMPLLEPKDQPIVLYCRSGHRSGLAYAQLKHSGFSQLYDLGPM